MIASIQDKINYVSEKYLRKDLPDFEVGDTVRMKIKVQEADKIRLHPFEGVVIRKTGRGLRGSFTVRKVSFGEGVERIFPTHSPVVESLVVVHKGVVKRSKLYYLRGRVGKKTRIKTDQAQAVSVTSTAAPIEAQTV